MTKYVVTVFPTEAKAYEGVHALKELDNEGKHANVYLKPDQGSLAIGRRGVNIKLACELTGYELDVYRDNEGEPEGFDIDLDEFSD